MSTQEEPVTPEDQDTSDDELKSGIRFIRWACVIIAVLLVGSLTRSMVVQDQVDKVGTAVDSLEESSQQTKESADHASEASEAALKELRDAISAIENANAAEPDLTNQAILDALQAIARIEAFVCGGTCPEPE